MSGTERRVSATEARVRFGELLDGVTTSHDVVFVERAGKEVAVVVSVEDWEAACAGRANKWARANAMLAEYHERLRAEGAICLLYTSPSPRDPKTSRMPSSA